MCDFSLYDNFNLETFKEEAKKHYIKKYFTLLEFNEDFRYFQVIANLFRKYKKNPKNKERLILNQIIIIHNCFGKFGIFGIFFKTDRDCWGLLKTFLIFINLFPSGNLEYDLIECDMELMKRLKEL